MLASPLLQFGFWFPWNKLLFLVKTKHSWHFNRGKIKRSRFLDDPLFLSFPDPSFGSLNFFPIFEFFKKFLSILVFVFHNFLPFFFFYNLPELLFFSIVPHSVSFCYDLHHLFQSLLYFSCLLFSSNEKSFPDFQYLRSGLELQNVNPKLKLAKVQDIQTWEEREI